METERPIAMFLVSPDSSFLCVTEGIMDEKGHFEGKAQTHIYNLASKKTTFTSNEYSPKKEKFRPVKGGILMSRRDNQNVDLQLIDKNDGHTAWAYSKLAGFMFNGESDFGLLFDNPLLTEIVGFQLDDGKQLWRKKVKRDFIDRFEQFAPLDSTHVIVVADKLYRIEKATGKEDICKYEFSPQGANVSLLVEGNKCYVSDKKNVFCLDIHSFQKLWNTTHPSVGLNSLTSYKGTLGLLNLGYIRTDSKLFPISNMYTPYLATYNKENGTETSMENIKWEKSRGLITDVNNDTVFYVYNSERKAFDQVKIGRDKMMVTAENGCVYIFDSHFNLLKQYLRQEVYYVEFALDNGVCVRHTEGNAKDYYFVQPDGRMTKHWPEGISSFCRLGDYLYYSIDNTLYEEDIAQLCE